MIRHVALQRWAWVREGKTRDDPGRLKAILQCGPCSDCHDRESWGCGWEQRTRGKATVGGETWDKLKTCPEWYALQPFMLSLYEWLPQYKEGRLGDVREMARPTVIYFEALSRARDEFQEASSDV